jgi:hypothetical protein
LACLAGLVGLVKSVTFPRAVAEHPVRANAAVTQVYINGIGGDPRVDYMYRVRGRAFVGSGDGTLGHEDLLSLHPGDAVAIEYAADVPSESCTCDAARDAPPSLVTSILTAAALTVPLAVLLWRRAPRWVRTRDEWFVPVRGLGEWVGLLGGVLVAVIVLAYAFASTAVT